MATPPEISAVIIPPFFKPDPALWFYMVEATFKIATPKPLTESKTNYNHVVAHLPPEIATVVRDIIMKPDPDDPYTALKSQIIDSIDDSLLLEIFIQMLPVPVQTTLASISPLTTEKASEVADRICEIESINSVGSVRACPSPTSKHLSTTKSLCEEIKSLRKTRIRSRSQSARRDRNRSKSLEKPNCLYPGPD